MEIEFPKPTDVLGRIAAQTAKQVIFQKVREAERENIFGEYNQRLGDVVNATVKRFETGDMIVEIGNRVEAVLPRKEQSRAESYNPGDRLRAVIKGVNRSAKGPQIVLSRTDPALLIKLFEQEVPEIYDGTVMIRGAVREAGDRAKVAVYSRERDVDPVGACVGMKGTRVQAIIRELRGEKIDIVEFSDDTVSFVTNALSPAKVQRVSIVGRPRKGDGSHRRGQAAVAGHRQEGPERPAGRQADRLADRHQERGGKAARDRGAARGSLDWRAVERRSRRATEPASGAEASRPPRPRLKRPRPARAPTGPRRTSRPRRSRSRMSSPVPRPKRGPEAVAEPEERWSRRERARQGNHRGNRLATVRIYKVAELLNTTSQEVMALLKRDHGIDVKSASSTIEEVVGRQFVERLARQRGVTLPGGDVFAEGAAAKAPARKPSWPRRPVPSPPNPRRRRWARRA